MHACVTKQVNDVHKVYEYVIKMGEGHTNEIVRAMPISN